jgi:hypothetical protein
LNITGVNGRKGVGLIYNRIGERDRRGRLEAAAAGGIDVQ